jgi:hypothetical protein
MLYEEEDTRMLDQEEDTCSAERVAREKQRHLSSGIISIFMSLTHWASRSAASRAR